MTQPGTPRIFEVRSTSATGHVRAHGARRDRDEAARLMAEQVERVMAVAGRVDGEYWVEEIDTTGLFELPRKPSPRERYTVRTSILHRPDRWDGVRVEVLDGDAVITSYDRNYSMLQTFEPFRRGDRDFALISPHYTATSVLDLQTGEIIAAEEPSGGGFCPVGFDVPDWWDVHDGAKLPGSTHWRPADDEWPSSGDFGFVWGCHWGDDTTWKVQPLDLADIGNGVIRRDDRYGYVKLATDPKLAAQDFIRCSSWEGERRVQFYVEQRHAVSTGAPIADEDW